MMDRQLAQLIPNQEMRAGLMGAMSPLPENHQTNMAGVINAAKNMVVRAKRAVHGLQGFLRYVSFSPHG